MLQTVEMGTGRVCDVINSAETNLDTKRGFPIVIARFNPVGRLPA